MQDCFRYELQSVILEVLGLLEAADQINRREIERDEIDFVVMNENFKTKNPEDKTKEEEESQNSIKLKQF